MHRAGPFMGPEGSDREAIMGYFLAVILGFVVLGIERLIAGSRTLLSERHEVPPAS